jgi:hypothetical protein
MVGFSTESWLQSRHSWHRWLDRICPEISANRIGQPERTRYLLKYVAGQIHFLRPIDRANLCLPHSSRVTSQWFQIPSWLISPKLHLSSPPPSSWETPTWQTHRQSGRPMVVHQHVAKRSYTQASAVEFLYSTIPLGHRRRLRASRWWIGNPLTPQLWRSNQVLPRNEANENQIGRFF